MMECSQCIHDREWPADCTKGMKMIHSARLCPHYTRHRKDHSLLYKPEMVLALLRKADPKEQTRRVITYDNSTTDGLISREAWQQLRWEEAEQTIHDNTVAWRVPFQDIAVIVSPRVHPGDLIWVREHWGYLGSTINMKGGKEKCYSTIEYHADGVKADIAFATAKEMHEAPPHQNIKHPEGYDDLDIYEQQRIHSDLLSEWWKKKRSIPGIHMPRWASRLDLDVHGVRTQRVQEISEADAKAEGVDLLNVDSPHVGIDYVKNSLAIDRFARLWDSINSERGFAWADNYPVWIYDFRRAD